MEGSKLNPLITVEYLQTKRENQYFERKGLGEKTLKASKLAEELIGMLNADGGTLAFGLSDSGEIQDLKELGNAIDTYRTLMIDFINPYPNIKLEEVEIDGKLLFLYHVELDKDHIYQRKDNEAVFLRVNDQNHQLDREAVRTLEYDKQIRRFEEEIIPSFNFADLDIELLEIYRNRLQYKGTHLELLEKRNLSEKTSDGVYQIKNAGILLFAKDPEKYIASASLRYVRYDGNEARVGSNHNVTKDVRFENNIPRIIEEVQKFMQASLNDYHLLNLEKGVFERVPEYPEDAWLEGIVNALCHRSYNIQGNTTIVKHFDDRLEISNSGPLPAQVTIENIRTERFARNPRVARVLEDFGYARQLNEGVSRIYESMEKSMLSIPEYRIENRNVYLTLRNKISLYIKSISDAIFNHIKSNWGELNGTQQGIINYLFYHNQGTLADFTTHVGINEKTIRLYLNGFINDGVIQRLSNKERDKNAVYIFKK
ncbi:MAG: ATP-binding protein [Mangrovibacterium sp.]